MARINWRSADPSVINGIKQCLAGDFADQAVSRLLNTLEPDEPVSIPWPTHAAKRAPGARFPGRTCASPATG
ncbi:hypothetical protein NKG94_16430 [Micromonospora sp. M12]